VVWSCAGALRTRTVAGAEELKRNVGVKGNGGGEHSWISAAVSLSMIRLPEELEPRCSVCRGSRLSVVVLAGAGTQPGLCEPEFQVMVFVTLAGWR
jgi:hypothetical protein